MEVILGPSCLISTEHPTMLPYFKTEEAFVNMCLKFYTRQNISEAEHTLNENYIFVLYQLFKYFTVVEMFHFEGSV